MHIKKVSYTGYTMQSKSLSYLQLYSQKQPLFLMSLSRDILLIFKHIMRAFYLYCMYIHIFTQNIIFMQIVACFTIHSNLYLTFVTQCIFAIVPYQCKHHTLYDLISVDCHLISTQYFTISDNVPKQCFIIFTKQTSHLV